MSIFDSVSRAVTGVKPRVSRKELIKRESEIGRHLFGPIPAGRRREFFNLDPHTWIWYEEWTDANGQQQAVTTRYEISNRGVLKVQDGQQYHYVRGQEAATFKQAVAKYYELVTKHVYGVTA